MKTTDMFKYLSVGAALLVSGCATSTPALQSQFGSDFGTAVKSNIAAQAVAPTAEQKANTFIPADPVRAGAARKNYRENTVPEPKRSSQVN
jgi:type IV pilus biogenesis protein CpaD/CtpE